MTPVTRVFPRAVRRAPVGRLAAAVLTLLPPLFAPGFAAAQATADLNVERIFGSEELSPVAYEVTWMPEPDRFARLVPDEEGVTEIWSVDAETGDSLKLVSAADLVPEGAEAPISLAAVQFARAARRILLFADVDGGRRHRERGACYVFDLTTRRLVPVGPDPGDQRFAAFSPDGTRVAYTRGGDLHVFDIETRHTRPLTRDGGGPVLNGAATWLYEEEFGVRSAFRWSPDGARIAFWRFDLEAVPEFPLIDETTTYPSATRTRYPKAGASTAHVRLGTVEVASGDVTWFDVEAADGAYLPWMEWAASSEEVVIQRLNRAQNRLELLLGVAATGSTRLLLSERSDTWVEAGRDLHWLAGGAAFVWPSDRGGYRHLYLYERDGRLRRQLTRGAWDVTAVAGVDTTAGVAYYEATAESPMTRAILSTDIDDPGDSRLLVGGRGMRSADFNPDFSRFIETSSTISTPPVYTLRDRSGVAIRVLEGNDRLADRLRRLGLREPEFIDVDGADGTRRDAWIIKPRTFDPTRAYPLLLYAHGGPGSQTVIDGWGGQRYLWHQMLVRRGVLVASVDNRGTGGRGRDFEHQVYGRLGQLEAADQAAAARDLGEQPFVDARRIGIWGWGYGGYVSLMSALAAEGDIGTIAAVAPVTDWELHDTAYTERFMGPPAENPEGYRLGAPARQADRFASFASNLLLVHGTGDRTVHAQHTMVLADALVEAGVPFDLALYPNRTHAISSGARVHLFERITRHVLDGLAPRPTSGAAGLDDGADVLLLLE